MPDIVDPAPRPPRVDRPNPRPYAEALEAWRSRVPRLPVWKRPTTEASSRSSCAGPRRAALVVRRRDRAPKQAPPAVTALTADHEEDLHPRRLPRHAAHARAGRFHSSGMTSNSCFEPALALRRSRNWRGAQRDLRLRRLPLCPVQSPHAGRRSPGGEHDVVAPAAGQGLADDLLGFPCP